MSDYIIDHQRGPHIRDYSDQSQDKVIIYSNTGCWAANGNGYTTSQMAGVYTRDDAYKRAGHCGPEKGCCFYDVPADHVPTLQAEVERFKAALECACKGLEAGYWSTRTFIDENVPGWVRGVIPKSYYDDPSVVALSAEFARLEARKQEIFEEVESKFPAPYGYIWGASVCKKHPLRLWLVPAEEDK